MRYRYKSKPQVRTIVVKYAGKCACCGVQINAGEMADYYPVGTIASVSTAQIAHVGGLDGNSRHCYAVLKHNNDAGFVDVDRAYEDQCAEICGR